MAKSSSAYTMGARFPVGAGDEPKPSPDIMERQFGVTRDDPARMHVIRALAALTMGYGIDLHEHPELAIKAIEKGRRDHAAEIRMAERVEAERLAALARYVPSDGYADGCVYYVQVGKLIKIGTTINLETRLKAYPPGAEVLAKEPGSYKIERQRHIQFRDCLAARSEWFHPSAALIEHINSLREQPLTAAELAA